jgi:hypothetical protein
VVTAVASYQVLYWQQIPSQVKVWDDFDEVSVPLSGRFVALIDQAAQQQGLTSTDDYLGQWRWGDVASRDGAVEQVARAVTQELEEAF